MKSLDALLVQDSSKIVSIQLEPVNKHRLQDLGLYKGVEVTVLQSSKYDKIVLLQNGSKLLIGKEVSQQIFVE